MARVIGSKPLIATYTPVADPTLSLQIVNKEYVDEQIKTAIAAALGTLKDTYSRRTNFTTIPADTTRYCNGDMLRSAVLSAKPTAVTHFNVTLKFVLLYVDSEDFYFNIYQTANDTLLFTKHIEETGTYLLEPGVNLHAEELTYIQLANSDATKSNTMQFIATYQTETK